MSPEVDERAAYDEMERLLKQMAQDFQDAVQDGLAGSGGTIVLDGGTMLQNHLTARAQVIGEAFPLTHFLRIVRGIMLKGSEFHEIAPHVWPLALILLVVSAAALKRYQRTLD